MTEQRIKTCTPSHEPGRVDPAETTGDSAVFSSLIEPYRRELHLHCYRMLGSLQDAEDLVQETMLRVWQHFDTFQVSSSLRTCSTRSRPTPASTPSRNACRARCLWQPFPSPTHAVPLRKLVPRPAGWSPSLTAG